MELGKQGILQAADVIKEQMPDLVEQLMRWEFTISLICFLVFPIMTIITWRACEYFYKKCDKDKIWIDYLSPRVGYLLILIWAFFLHFTWLKILIAPKLFLVGYISNLIK